MAEDSNDKFVGQCTNCGKKLTIPMQYLRRQVKCSACQTTFVAQPTEDAESARPAPPSPPQKQKPVRRPMAPVDDGVSPDVLMGDFQGKKLVMVVILAIICHVFLIGGTSVGYLRDEVFGKDTSEMSKEEKVQIAIGEATSALSKIAKRHNLELEDITDRFSGGGSRSDKVADKPNDKAAAAKGAGTTPDKGTAKGAGDEDKAKSKFEKDMTQPKKGPDDVGGKIDDDFGL